MSDLRQPPIVRQVGTAAPGSSTAPAVRSKWVGLLDNRPAILALLFLVTGLFGIPLLWISDRFSRTEKIVWSIVVTLYTLLLIGATIAICWWVYLQVSQLMIL